MFVSSNSLAPFTVDIPELSFDHHFPTIVSRTLDVEPHAPFGELLKSRVWLRLIRFPKSLDVDASMSFTTRACHRTGNSEKMPSSQ